MGYEGRLSLSTNGAAAPWPILGGYFSKLSTTVSLKYKHFLVTFAGNVVFWPKFNCANMQDIAFVISQF